MSAILKTVVLGKDMARTVVSEMTTTELRDVLADAVNRVCYADERIIITRHGRRIAELVPYRDVDNARRTSPVNVDERSDGKIHP